MFFVSSTGNHMLSTSSEPDHFFFRLQTLAYDAAWSGLSFLYVLIELTTWLSHMFLVILCLFISYLSNQISRKFLETEIISYIILYSWHCT